MLYNLKTRKKTSSFLLPVKIVLEAVQLKWKSYLHLKTGWNAIYTWDCMGRVMDPGSGLMYCWCYAVSGDDGTREEEKAIYSTSARVYIVLNLNIYENSGFNGHDRKVTTYADNLQNSYL